MSDKPAVIARNNEAENRFEAEIGGFMGFAEYRLGEGEVTFTHTEVPHELEGKGVAGALAKAALEWARSEKLAVVPRCSFFAAYMKRHPETQDLLNDKGREVAGL